MPARLHYLVLHPESSWHEVRVAGPALTEDSGPFAPSWRGRAFVDWTGSNSDPLVLGQTWLYSYCKIVYLDRQVGTAWKRVMCAIRVRGLRSQGRLVVDTVFWIARALEWKNGILPIVFSRRSRRTRLWREHLAAGGRVDPGRHSYEGRRWPRYQSKFSYLPTGRFRPKSRAPPSPRSRRPCVRSWRSAWTPASRIGSASDLWCSRKGSLELFCGRWLMLFARDLWGRFAVLGSRAAPSRHQGGHAAFALSSASTLTVRPESVASRS